MKFRDDINGLRGIAVAGVVLYHFNVAGFAGGYAGVDVFFVISGFLMTGIILGQLEAQRFSLANFYLNRAKRIIPALAALCLALMVAGYFWLIPSDLQNLGKHAAAAITFISNFIFKGEQGYFDAPMRDTWLLHTWSLSTEWQFYLLYPLALMAWAKYTRLSRKHLLCLMAALAAATFALSVYATPAKANMAFYLLPARVWEFVAGGALCLLPAPRRRAAVFEIAGLLLILLSFFTLQDSTPWPGYMAALPVLGAAMVIYAARPQSRVTGNAPLQLLGKTSYSIYLWHWPVFVGMNYFGIAEGAWFTVTGILASLALGGISYAVIETPAREKMPKVSLPRAFAGFAVLLAVIGGMGLGLAAAKGLPARVSARINAIDQASSDKYQLEKDCHFSQDSVTTRHCTVGKGNDVQFALWGDSHAGAISSAVAAAAQGKGLLYLSFCPTMFGVETSAVKKAHCAKFNDMIFNDIKQLPKNIPLIIINRYSNYLQNRDKDPQKNHDLFYAGKPAPANANDAAAQYRSTLTKTLCTIAADRKLYVVKPIPEMEQDVPKTLARRLMAHGTANDMSVDMPQYESRNRDALAALDAAQKGCGVTLLDPAPALCTHGKCAGSDNLKPLYFDSNHLNEWGNKRLVPMLAPVFNK
ncbi:MAG: acyltransferase family protein [Micavibrio sp.]|nr:acyltransferase family protein [Micavibrio sp.]